MREMRIEITQINWDGKGNNRTFTQWCKPSALETKLNRIRQGFNMDSTEIRVEGEIVKCQERVDREKRRENSGKT